MEIETQMAADRDRAAAEKALEQARNDPTRRKREVEVGGSAVRRPIVKGPRKIGGLSASSSTTRPTANGTGGSGSGSSVVKKPIIPRRPGRTF